MTDQETTAEPSTPPAPPAALVEAVAAAGLGPRRVPRATYRVQLHAGFTFRDATRIVPYLAALGVDHLYASPHLKANPGSAHGYDVVDYNRLNPEIGDEFDYEAMLTALREHGMGLLVDFVPNHMGIAGGANPWWQDVLENGQTSAFAGYFDIDWEPLKPELQGQVLLPLLGDHYGAVLENGEIRLRLGDGAFTLWYYALPLPVAPPTYPLILRRALDALAAAYAPDDLPHLEYLSILTAFERLPPQGEQEPERLAERQREQVVAKRRLGQLLAEHPRIAAALNAAIREINGTPGDPHSFDALDELIGAQSYRLSYWKVAAEEINYRRFFAINELAAIRQEEPAVFAATHELVLRLAGEGKIDGLRIDHPDGLWDPAGYFRSLQRAAFLARCRAVLARKPPRGARAWAWEDLEPALAAWWDGQWAETGDRDRLAPLYLLVEKILEHGEELPRPWAVDGTVGYEFAQAATGLFVDGGGRKAFDELYARFTGGQIRFADLVYEAKKLIMRVALASEVNVLARALDRITERQRRTRDFTLNNLRFAMREIIACFPVYRTYVDCERAEVSARDQRTINEAVRQAKRRNPAGDPSAFDFVRDVLLLRYAEDATAEQRADYCRFGMKFQQLTGPVMAKGLEDTAFYVYNRLTALNEVGGDPATFGMGVAEFHRANAARLEAWPHAMLTSSTHDTKRSEDVRARIDVLSEIPREWRAALNRWARLNRRHKTKVEGAPAPDRNDEYLFYQTLLGAWPPGMERPDGEFVERMEAYLLKAIREAQVHTSWINQNDAYDQATAAFVRAALASPAAHPNPFLDDVASLRRRVAHAGAFNAIAQQLLKLTAPGVPDIYQGTELWDLSLVDPDNRRPVDYRRRTRALDRIAGREPNRTLAKKLLDGIEDGRIKLHVTHRALRCRAEHPDLFAAGDYLPLTATGAKAAHVVAFARRLGTREVIVVVPRLVAGLLGGEQVPPIGPAIWGDTRLPVPEPSPAGRYRSRFTGEVVSATEGELALAEVFADFPVALLERIDDAS